MIAVSASTMIEMRSTEEMHKRLEAVLKSINLDGAEIFRGLIVKSGERRRFDLVLQHLRFCFAWGTLPQPGDGFVPGAGNQFVDQFVLRRPDDDDVAALVERFVKLLIAALVADAEVQQALLRELMPSASVAPVAD